MPTPSRTRDQALRDRYIAYLKSKDFKPILKRLGRPPAWRFVVAFVTFMTTILIPITLYQLFRILGHRRRTHRELIEFAERAVPIMVYPLMVNSALRSVPNTIAPGLVIGSFEPEANETMEFMAGLAVRILGLSMEEAGGPDQQAAQQLLADERYVPNRRRLLPPSLTGGQQVYALDLMMVGDYLPGGTVNIPLIPCLAEPGPEGRIEMIPSWVVTQALGSE